MNTKHPHNTNEFTEIFLPLLIIEATVLSMVAMIFSVFDFSSLSLF
jgi:hypothetical protein